MRLCLVKINLAVSVSVLTCVVVVGFPIEVPYYQFPTVGKSTIGKKVEQFNVKFLLLSCMTYVLEMSFGNALCLLFT